jgi:hypothetical protein
MCPIFCLFVCFFFLFFSSPHSSSSIRFDNIEFINE